jgi:hypothetical protein
MGGAGMTIKIVRTHTYLAIGETEIEIPDDAEAAGIVNAVRLLVEHDSLEFKGEDETPEFFCTGYKVAYRRSEDSPEITLEIEVD